MTARCYVAGRIAPSSQPAAITVRGAVVEPTRTPIVALTPCEVCGAIVCDCQDWLEWMALAEPLPRECIGDAA